MDKTKSANKEKKRKQTSFNFTPRKLDINDTTQTTVAKPLDSPKNKDISEGSSIDFTQLNDYTIPIGLRNPGVNACFFNSIIQILCTLAKFRVYIQNEFHRNDDIKIINTLVHDVISANQPVNTYNDVVRLNIPNYQHGTQFDAHEFFVHLLDRCYLTLNDVENSML